MYTVPSRARQAAGAIGPRPISFSFLTIRVPCPRLSWPCSKRKQHAISDYLSGHATRDPGLLRLKTDRTWQLAAGVAADRRGTAVVTFVSLLPLGPKRFLAQPKKFSAMAGTLRPPVDGYRLWLVSLEDPLPSDGRRVLRGGTVLAPATPEILSAPAARAFVETFNRAMQADGRPLWCVCVPVRWELSGDLRAGALCTARQLRPDRAGPPS